MGLVADRERDRCSGTLVGLAVGDALGMPAEEMSASEIRLTWGTIEGFETAPAGRPCSHLRPGQWTDDTQLAIVLAESLVSNPEFDAADLGARLAQWFREQAEPASWRYPGTACLEAAGRLAEGVPPGESGVDGAGCGAAMRVAPVGVLLRHAPSRLREVAEAQALLTHVNSLAVEGTVAVARAVGRLCLDPGGDGGVTAVLKESARFLERREIGLSTSDVVERAGTPLAELYAPRGPSGWTAHAVPAAVQAFVSHPGDFEAVVLDAVNAGGDTDSVGAMAGALAGAALGFSAIPKAWRDGVEQAERVRALSEALFEKGAPG